VDRATVGKDAAKSPARIGDSSQPSVTTPTRLPGTPIVNLSPLPAPYQGPTPRIGTGGVPVVDTRRRGLRSVPHRAASDRQATLVRCHR
jgi:hypothetical protein